MKHLCRNITLFGFILLLVTSCGGGGGGGGNADIGDININTGNDPDAVTVTADAGASQNGSIKRTVTLQGSGTTSSQDPLSYNWTFNSVPLGSNATLANADTVNPTFYPDQAGNYIAQLIVSSGETISKPDTVLIQAFAPVADAGPNRLVSTGEVITVDGSKSNYSGSETLVYKWEILSQPEGSASIIIDDEIASPTFTPTKDGTYKLQLTVNNGVLDINGDLVQDTDSVTIAATTIPVANAGPDATVSTGSTIGLNGSGSSTSNGARLTYLWSIINKPATSFSTLSDPTAAQPSFVATVQGTYTFSLIVNNGTENSAADTVTITVTPPLAVAGADTGLSTLETITLDGSNSSDASNAPLTYLWEIFSSPAASNPVLSNATRVNPTFTTDTEGEYTLNLTVNNGTESSMPDSITLSVSTPVANAGSDLKVSTGTTVNLNANASDDANNNPLTYRWTMTSQPASSNTALANSDTQTPSFIADRDGLYELNLVVNNGFINSAADSITITSTTAPVANAGADQNVSAAQSVNLDGTNSSDSNDASLIYVWRIISVPSGSNASLSQITSSTPSFIADLPGTYIMGLTVNNGIDSSSEDSVEITAFLPVADAGPDFNEVPGKAINLDGRNSSDINNRTLSYRWTITASPLGSSPSLSDSSLQNPVFNATTEGAYEVSLIVNNGLADSLADTTIINIRNSVGNNSGIYSTDFENSSTNAQWAVSNGIWEIGAPTSGPGIAYVGTSLAATVLDAYYVENVTSRFESPPISLPALTTNESISLRFWHWFDFYPGRPNSLGSCFKASAQDYGQLQIAIEETPGVWGEWVTLSTYTNSSGYTSVNSDLSTYANQKIKIGFLIVNPVTPNSCTVGTKAGWYIDELIIESVSTL